MTRNQLPLRSLFGWVALLASGPVRGAEAGSTSLNAFVPVCGGSAGQFVYSSPALRVRVARREIVLHSHGGAARFSYDNAEQHAIARGTQPLPGRVNVFKETLSCGALPMFGELAYSTLYPGVSLRLQVRDRALKSEYLVEPGSDPGRIAMRYSEAEAPAR